MSLCQCCQDWFQTQWANGFGDALDQTRRKFPTSSETSFDVTSKREWATIVQSRELCWLCSRITYYVSRYESHLAEDGHRFEEDGTIQINLICRRISPSSAYPWEPQNRFASNRSLRADWRKRDWALVAIRLGTAVYNEIRLYVDPELSSYLFAPDRDCILYTMRNKRNSPWRLAKLSPGSSTQDRPCLDPGPPSLDDRLHALRRWLSVCESTHGARCSRPGDFLPTRLIQLEGEGLLPRLVHSSSLPRHTKYATLSHCWGKAPFQVLRTDSLHEFEKRLPMHLLGRTFQDAMLLCEKLGIGYLWIDCLCILQDSADEWNKEAVTMHHVYGNSYLNIAASASASASGGLFRPRDDALARDLVIALPDGSLMFEDREWITVFILRDHNDQPLMERGWVLQECFTAPRTLFWEDAQMFLHCKSGCDGEIAQVRNSNPVNWLRKFLYEDDMAGMKLWELSAMWRRIVEDFSGTRVTLSKDKYFAIAGLAAQMATHFRRLGQKTRYIAGCWEHDILSWVRWEQKLHASRGPWSDISGSYIPSWSWLSSNEGRLDMKQALDSPHEPRSRASPELLDVVVSYADPNNMFGPVDEASLLMSASCFTVVRGGTGKWDYTAGLSKERSGHPFSFRGGKICDLCVWSHSTDLTMTWKPCDILRPEMERIRSFKIAVLYQPTIMWEWLPADTNSAEKGMFSDEGMPITVYGMILGSCDRSDDEGRRYYERLGTWKCEFQLGSSLWLHASTFFRVKNLERENFWLI